MVYFQKHRWLPVGGKTQVSARISSTVQKAEDVHWSVDLHYVAGGAAWRRVKPWKRPALSVGVSGFFRTVRSWKDLERLKFWNRPDQFDDEDDDLGCLDVAYHPQGEGHEGDNSLLNDHLWRMAAREGHWFTVELAGFADGRNFLRSLKQESVVTADGSAETREPDAEFWKRHASLYLVENVPFGTVTVQAPRNARDVEAYAVRRARELVGTGEPERIEARDFFKHNPQCSESIRDDVFVVLHFNGSYEE